MILKIKINLVFVMLVGVAGDRTGYRCSGGPDIRGNSLDTRRNEPKWTRYKSIRRAIIISILLSLIVVVVVLIFPHNNKKKKKDRLLRTVYRLLVELPGNQHSTTTIKIGQSKGALTWIRARRWMNWGEDFWGRWWLLLGLGLTWRDGFSLSLSRCMYCFGLLESVCFVNWAVKGKFR